jgi:hypothetical protein
MNSFIKRHLVFTIVLLVYLLGPSKAEAQSLNFNPKTSKVDVGKTVSVEVIIDAGTKQVAGTDVYVLYDSTVVSIQSVTGGDYFPLVDNKTSTNKIYISGVIANPGEYKTGTGKVATLVFKAEKAGEATLKILCELTGTETSKINQNDINASNIIDCSKTGNHVMTIAQSTTSSGGTTTVAAPTAAPSLPEAGVADSVFEFSIIGGTLLLFGGLLRAFLLK